MLNTKYDGQDLVKGYSKRMIGSMWFMSEKEQLNSVQDDFVNN